MLDLIAIILNWSFQVTLSDVLALAGFLFAWQQYRSAMSAKQVVAETRRSMFKQRAAQHFSEISNKAGLLAGAVRSHSWDQVAEVATALGGLVSSASGFADKIMLDDEKGSLTIAADGIKFVLDQVPADEQPPDPNAMRAMISQCTLIVYAVERVAGRMRYLGELEDGDLEINDTRITPSEPAKALGDKK